MGSMRWQVSGNNYYARDSVKGRAFFASWFDNRCTFKDQYSLWHTILELAAAEGCVDYAGEIFSLTYSDTRGMGPTHKNYIKLDCDTIDARCPGFRYSNRGGATCDANTPHLLGDLHHRSIGTDGKDFPALRRMFGVMSGTTTACPRARRRVREVTGARHRRRDRPLVQVRQRALRAQSLDRHPARRRAAAVATVKRWPGQVRVPRDGQRQVGHHQKNEAWRREEEFGGRRAVPRDGLPRGAPRPAGRPRALRRVARRGKDHVRRYRWRRAAGQGPLGRRHAAERHDGGLTSATRASRRSTALW